MRLDIGCGVSPANGFIGVDRYVAISGGVIAEMWDLPYPDNSIDEIYSSHALEHIGKRQVVPTLEEWRRVLKPGAPMTIFVPDLEWCCRNWLENQNNGWHLDTLFGNQDHPGEFHKTGFTKSMMIGYLYMAGFRGEAQVAETFDHEQNTLVFIVRKNDGFPK